LYQKITVDDIEAIQVVQDDNGEYLALTGNRRLFVYKWLHRLGIVSTIPINIQSAEDNASRLRDRKTTKNGGRDIDVRQPIAVRQMEAIESDWRRVTGRTAVVRVAAVVPSTHSSQNEIIEKMSTVSLSEPRQSVDNHTKLETILERYRRQAATERAEQEQEEQRKNDEEIRRWTEILAQREAEQLRLRDERLAEQRFLRQRQVEERLVAERLRERQRPLDHNRDTDRYYIYGTGKPIEITRQYGG